MKIKTKTTHTLTFTDHEAQSLLKAMEYILYRSKRSKDIPPINASSLAKIIINEFRSNEASIAKKENHMEDEDELDEEFEKNFELE